MESFTITVFGLYTLHYSWFHSKNIIYHARDRVMGRGREEKALIIIFSMYVEKMRPANYGCYFLDIAVWFVCVEYS